MLQCHQCRKVLGANEGGHRRVMQTGQDYSRTVNLCPRCAEKLQRTDQSNRTMQLLFGGVVLLLLAAVGLYWFYCR